MICFEVCFLNVGQWSMGKSKQIRRCLRKQDVRKHPQPSFSGIIIKLICVCFTYRALHGICIYIYIYTRGTIMLATILLIRFVKIQNNYLISVGHSTETIWNRNLRRKILGGQTLDIAVEITEFRTTEETSSELGCVFMS